MAAICLINPVRATPPARAEILKGYLSLGLLASALRDAGFLGRFASRAGLASPSGAQKPFDVRILHLGPALDPEDMAAALSRAFRGLAPPSLVGVTTTADRVAWARLVARTADRLWPAVPRIAGGPHASTSPDAFLAHGAFHAVCRGEGVETIVELALRLRAQEPFAWRNVDGLAFSDPAAGTKLTPPRRPLFAPDDYPYASRSLDLFLGEEGSAARHPEDMVFLWAGHGCPRHCSFCAQRAVFGGKIRERGAASLVGEIAELQARGYRNYALVQETFFNRRERVEEFLRRVAEAGLAIRWTAEARCDQLDRPLLERLRASGLKMIQIGLESGDPEVLARIGKGFSLEQAAKVIDDCRELGIDTAVYLLVGLPGQGWRSVLLSARFLERHPPRNRTTGHVAVAVALPYPGTRIAREGSVRLVAPGNGGSFPERTPRVRFDAAGGLEVEPITETDHLSGREISEAFFFLDDFLQFRTAARAGTPVDRYREMQEYADRLLAMMVHRTIRDLALPEPTGSGTARRAALDDLLQRHGPENRIAEMSDPRCAPLDEDLLDFLSCIRLSTGRRALAALNWRERFQVVRFAARCWAASGRAFDRLAVTPDDGESGRRLVEALSDAPSRVPRRQASRTLILEPPRGPNGHAATCGRPS